MKVSLLLFIPITILLFFTKYWEFGVGMCFILYYIADQPTTKMNLDEEL